MKQQNHLSEPASRARSLSFYMVWQLSFCMVLIRAYFAWAIHFAMDLYGR